MGIQTVTILVQSVIILLAVVFAAWGWLKALRLEATRQDYVRAVDVLVESQKRDQGKIEDLTEANERLKQQLSQIPLPEKSKRVDNPIKHARTSGDVRRLTEQAWGGKPDAA